MEEEKIVTFFVVHGKDELIIQLYEYDTVELLKIEIHKKFQIPAHKQIIEGWKNVPQSEDTILKMCVQEGITYLRVQRSDYISPHKDMELEAAHTFINKFANRLPSSPLEFNICKLSHAISDACLGSLAQRKALLLCLHAGDDKFSRDLLNVIRKPKVIEILQKSFFLLGWDIEDTKFHSALTKALNDNELDVVDNLVKAEKSAVLSIVPIKDSVTIFNCIRTISEKSFIEELTAVEKAVIDEVALEKELKIMENQTDTNEYIDSERFHLMMAERLGDRDYDGFDYDQHESLKDKIGFALFGPPQAETDMELEAAHTFINKFANRLPSSPLEFNICKLSHAISDACLGSLAQRKALLLCLHAGDDKFSRDLLNVIRKPKVIEILQKSFFLLGWDIEDTKFHSALTKALNDNELDVVDNLVKAEKSAVLSIVPIKDSVTIFNCIRTISEKSFIEELTAVEKAVIDEVALEKELKIMENQTDTNEYIDSERFHLMMAERLGDRDYDGFDYDQHESLKDKIGFALFGPPQAETGYNDKQKQKIDKLFNIILVNSNDIAQYKDRVEIAFIYNCLEPLPQEKIKKKEENKDYNPKTDIMPIPIFVLRKCVGSDDPCRLFIDDTGRVYETFQNYIKYNKLHACFMVLPSNGRYTFDRDENLMLESHLSPACQVDAKILQGCDYASTAGGLLSGGVLLAAAIPAIPVAPVAVIGAGLTGLGVGIYSIGRSIFTLHDKYKHKESLSFADSETRGAYLNIVAGALGFAGAGANVAVTQLVSRGVPIGKGVSAFVTGIGIVNIGASGVSVFNSGYDIYDQWFNEEQTPSLLTIVQLSSSLLFFGNAVYSFKTCATMVHETQSRVLQDYKESLRSNRHRKTFNKLMKATIGENDGNAVRGRAEVIAAVRNIQNKDEVFAVLTRSNKEMNKKGIKFTAVNGEIKLNGISVDMNALSSMSKKQVSAFLTNLPTDVEVTSVDTKSMAHTFSLSNIPTIDTVVLYAAKLLLRYGSDVRAIIVDLTSKLLTNLTSIFVDFFDELFPNRSKYQTLLNVVMTYFSETVEKLEEQYQMWKRTWDQRYHLQIFDFVDVEKLTGWVKLFEYAVRLANGDTTVILKLVEYFTGFWFPKQISEYTEKKERESNQRQHSAKSPTLKISCRTCNGYYYQRI